MKIIHYTILFLCLSLHVNAISAAKLSTVVSTDMRSKDQVFIEVYLNTERKKINAVDGSLIIDGFANRITSINTAGSPFTLWPGRPSLIGNTLTLNGGVPGGIQDSSVLLFTITARNVELDKASIVPKDLFVYLDNGRGDGEKVGDATLFLDAEVRTSSELQKAILNDTTPPKRFSVDIGKDEELFDGKYFISFTTSDEHSGVRQYEVQEGTSTPILADSPYLLTDQTLSTVIKVRATDNAGNSVVATLQPEYKLPLKVKVSIILITSLIVLATCRYLWIRKRKHTKYAK